MNRCVTGKHDLAGDIHHPAVACSDTSPARHVAENDGVAGLKVHLKDAHFPRFEAGDAGSTNLHAGDSKHPRILNTKRRSTPWVYIYTLPLSLISPHL